MATFINPIEILHLDAMDLATIDAGTIKKAKRQLFADIDLSDDGHLTYKGNSLTKTDCEAAVDQLDQTSLIGYYHYLSKTPKFNEYLASGDEAWFAGYTQDDIFADPGFMMFVSPYLAPRLDRSLLRAYQDNNAAGIKAILRAIPLVNGQDVDKAYRSLSHEIQTKIEDVDRTKAKVVDEEVAFTEEQQAAIGKMVTDAFPIEALNALPIYFQSQINKVASSVNFLQVAFYERFDTPGVPYVLLEHILQLRLEGADKPTFLSNFDIIKKRHSEWLLETEHAPALAPWKEALQTIRKTTKLVEAKIEKPSDVLDKIRATAPVRTLNELPAFADGVRTQIATAIRGLAIAAWNTHDDIRTSMALIRIALDFVVPHEVKEGFRKDMNELQDLEKKYQGIVTCYFCGTRPPVEGCGHKTTIYKETSREWFPQRKVEFKYIEVTLARCKQCKEIHEKGNEYMLYFSVGGGVIGALLGAVLEGEHYFLGGLIGLGVGVLAGFLQKRYQFQQNQILGLGNASLKKHPMLVDHIRDGWSLNKPTA